MAEPSETTLASRTSETASEAELLGAVRALADQVGGLQAELQALRASSGPWPGGEADVAGWEVDAPARRDGSLWMRSVASPGAGRPAVPRLLVEILFLVAVACLAAVARLDTPLVIAVMAGAWALVAALEWASERSARLGAEAAFGRQPATGADGAWSPSAATPPYEISAERTAKLPPPAAE